MAAPNTLQSRRQVVISALAAWQLSISPAAAASRGAALQPQLLPLSAQQTEHIDRSDSLDRSTALSLDNIRQSLIRQEETIIFSLIERAQFAHNQAVYVPDAIPVPGFSPTGERHSLLEYLVRETEQIHGKIRRFTSPDQHAFYPDDLPSLVLPHLQYREVLAPYHRSINLNPKIMHVYLHQLLDAITAPGDDSNYGSAAMYDVLCLQALSQRIHYGKFVAEAKFRAQKDKYTLLILDQDAEGIMTALTDKAVEKRVLERVRQKAAVYGQDYEGTESGSGSSGSSDTANCKVQPDTVTSLYERWVMPLTKEVEVAYLLRRLESEY